MPAAPGLFYPAAALYAALVLPLSVFWVPQWHPREMLFGFALAVVAGNQLGAAPAARVRLLFALWLGARLAVLALPWIEVSAVANGAFAVALAAQAAPRPLAAAKKWRNRALPAIVVGICVAAAALQVRLAVLLFAALMLFMGGRIIAAMAAGQLERQGTRLGPRVQPRLEGALIAAMVISLLWTPFCAVARALAAARLARWRLWVLRGRPDLLCLASGYGWLALGLATFGIAVALGRYDSRAVHLITAGAIGTLTFNVMALSWLRTRRRDPAREPLIVAGTVLIAAATLLRAGLAYHADAAACWSAAYLLLIAIFARAQKAPGYSR
ncbi:MAG TPA: NnrS family protein [Burkholderiales bacterium]|nr:NnrS family protein [Burkholderiales bacterium]